MKRLSKKEVNELVRNIERIERHAARCPHHACEHRAYQHRGKGKSCSIKNCTCPDIGAVVFGVVFNVEITYLRPNEVHDEGFDSMMMDILRQAQKHYKKYKFSLESITDITTLRTLRKKVAAPAALRQRVAGEKG